jgi:hypothetical protein
VTAARIFKYTLKIIQEQEVKVPICSKVLCAKVQFGNPVIYVIAPDVQITQKFMHIKIFMFETGEEIPDKFQMEHNYIGTFKLNEGKLMLHIFV